MQKEFELKHIAALVELGDGGRKRKPEGVFEDADNCSEHTQVEGCHTNRVSQTEQGWPWVDTAGLADETLDESAYMETLNHHKLGEGWCLN